MENKINLQITAAEDTVINAAIQTIISTLQPKLLTLTNDERKGGIKMGDTDIAFIDKGYSYGNQFSANLPPYVSLPNLKVDVDTVNKLNTYFRPLSTFMRSVEDTMMVAGSEAKEGSLLVYGAIKGAAHNNVNGAQEAYNDMRTHFPGRPKKQTPPKQ